LFAQVEIAAKVFAGYDAGNVGEYKSVTKESLKDVKGREYQSDEEK
jgi:hypothetical protein